MPPLVPARPIHHANGVIGSSSNSHTSRPAEHSPASAHMSTELLLTLRLSGTDTTLWPYRRCRAALESLFAARQLSAPWALCPSTPDRTPCASG